MRNKLTPEQIKERKDNRRVARSAFLSRFVDEFKKVGFIWTVFFCMGIIVWGMALYTKGVTTPGIQVAISAAFVIIGTAFTVYCNAASRDKDSLNKNGLMKSSDGTISKIVAPIVEAAKTILTSKQDPPGGDAVG